MKDIYYYYSLEEYSLSLFSIIEDRIELNESKNEFNRKFLESKIYDSNEFHIFINEEYSIRDLLIQIERFDLSIYEKDNEESRNNEEEIYNKLLSINLQLYENIEDRKKKNLMIKNIIIYFLNDILSEYDIRI